MPAKSAQHIARVRAALEAEITPHRLGDELPFEWLDLITFESRLIEMISRLPADRRAAAARTAVRIRDGHWQFQLGKVLPHLEPDQLNRAVSTAVAIKDPEQRVHALAGIVGHLPADRRPATVDAALLAATDDRFHRGVIAAVPADPDVRWEVTTWPASRARSL